MKRRWVLESDEPEIKGQLRNLITVILSIFLDLTFNFINCKYEKNMYSSYRFLVRITPNERACESTLAQETFSSLLISFPLQNYDGPYFLSPCLSIWVIFHTSKLKINIKSWWSKGPGHVSVRPNALDTNFLKN